MNNNKNKAIELKIIFAGTSPLAKDILEELVKNEYNIIAAMTQPDKKVGRKQEIIPNTVKTFCQEKNIDILQPEKIDAEFVQKIKDLKPDLVIVAAYGKILSQAFLDIPGFGCINVHTSLLPKLRGPSPIQNALLLGKTKTGVTIMLMDAGVDTGDVLTRFEVKIDSNDTTPTLSEKLSRHGAELLIKTIPLWINKQIEPEKQNNSHATLCQLIEKNDGKILWNETAQEIYNKFRAFYSWPGIFCFWSDGEKGSIKRIKLTDISIEESLGSEKRHLGEVFKSNESLCVQTASGIIVIKKLQLEGKSEMDALSFTNGYPNFIGSILK